MEHEVVRLIIRRLATNSVSQIGSATVAPGGSTVGANSGGGPRDIRWPEGTCGDIIGRMFRGRTPNGDRGPDFCGMVNFIPTGAGAAAQHQLTFMAPKPDGARTERRLQTNSTVGFDLTPYVVPDPNGGAHFIIIFETANGVLRLRMCNQTELEGADWDARVQNLSRNLQTGTEATSLLQFELPPSSHALGVIHHLAQSGSVLLSGPPGTGKSHLMAEVRHLFMEGMGAFRPEFDPTTGFIGPPAQKALPQVRADRKSFSFPMHQSARHSDFLAKRIPNPTGGWMIDTGPLHDASEHAKKKAGHSLLLLDELNRGPAAEIIGPAMVGFDLEARLSNDGAPELTTQFFQAINPKSGKSEDYALPRNLWILAGRNTADSSATSLDKALLRRFKEIKLKPDATLLRQHFNITGNANDTRSELLHALVYAFEAINSRILRTDMPEFQIGHGTLMKGPENADFDMGAAMEAALFSWQRMISHLQEAFAGREDVIGAILGIVDSTKHPLRIEEDDFADIYQSHLRGVDEITSQNLLALFQAISGPIVVDETIDPIIPQENNEVDQ